METVTLSEYISRSSSEAGSSYGNADIDCGNPFMCEMCDTRNTSYAEFKERCELDVHILKNHSTVCIGCYDVFESRKRLFEHLEVEKHEKPSYCDQCRGVFLDEADMRGHNCGDKSSVIEESLLPVKEECVSSDDDEEDRTMAQCDNAFLCEICDFADQESNAVFKDRSDLVLHTFKNHPCSCIGCFEGFYSSDDLKEHVVAESHGMPFCRKCWRLFPDNVRLVSHPCEPIAINEDNGDETFEADENEDEEVHVKMEPRREENEDEEVHVKMGPRSEDEGSEYLYSSEEDSNDESEPNHQLGKSDLSCLHCTAEGFRKQHDLRVHTCNVHPSVCIVCFEGFDDEASLHKHQKVMHHTVWKCSRCDKYFIRRAFYRTHVSVNHPEDCPHQCPVCDMRSFSKTHIMFHRRKKHGHYKFKFRIKLDWQIFSNRCSICLKTFMTGYSLVLHMFREHNEPGQTHVYKCELCQLGFGRGTAFELHLKEDHADDPAYINDVKTLLQSTLTGPVICDICGYRASTSSTLQRHILNKHPELRPHKCNICDARYPEESDVRVHICCEHEGPAAIVCPVCNVTARKTNALERHLKMHHGYQGMPYMYCFVHERKLVSYAHFRGHFEARHMDPEDRVPKPRTGFPCQFCGKEYGEALRLRYHVERVHFFSGERVKCDVCGMSLKNKAILAVHKRKHTDAFRCKICNKGFEMQCFLDRHQVVHSGEKPFQCEVCGLKLTQKSSLQRHLKVVHADGKPLFTPLLKPRRTRRPKSEGRIKKKTETDEVQNIPTEDQEVPRDDNVKEKCTRNRKRRKDSKSPSGALSEVATLPKRRRGRPKKDEIEVEEQNLSDDVKTKSNRRGRSRKAKYKAARQLHLQATSDDAFSDDEELLSNFSDEEDE